MKRINITLVSSFIVLFLCLSFTLAAEKEVGRDGVYVAYANGIVKDTKTGLEWKAGPDKDTDWNEARSWVQNLNLDGGGWRMPTTDELKTLYKKGAGFQNMTPLLKTTGFYVWSGEPKGSSDASYLRVFAVRSQAIDNLVI